MNNYLNIKNKQFLVTGVTSGIGKGICLQLLEHGATVIGIGRNESKIKDINHNSFVFKSLDLTEIETIEPFIKEVTKEKGKFDGFVHCAGKEETIPLTIYKHDKIKSIFDINVFSGIEILRILSKKKFTNEYSSIIFFSSVMGELGQPGKVGYCATKSAILGVVKAASLELAKRNIRVNALSPGVVMTPMTKQLFNQLPENDIKGIRDMHPLGFGKIDNITPTVLFLLSSNASWITGQNIKIDGGYSVH